MGTLAACILLASAATGPAGSTLAPSAASPFDTASPLGQAVIDGAIAEDLFRLQRMFASTPAQFPARGIPAPVRAAFVQPFATPEIARALAGLATADAAARPIRAVARHAAASFGTGSDRSDDRSTVQAFDPQRAIFALDFLLNGAAIHVRPALEAAGVPTDPAARAQWARRAMGFARLSTARGNAVPEAVAAAIQAAMTLDRDALVRAAGHLDEAIDPGTDWKAFEAEPLPEELAGAVDGAVLTTHFVPELGWMVVGGIGQNRYDMSRVAAVLDPGGDDRYEWSGAEVGDRLVVDLGGDDRYATIGDDPFAGPAGAAFGVSFIDDHAGNDTYAGTRNALGSAFFGVGILLDRAGNDRFEGGEWTIGSGWAGIGALLDLAGDDLHRSEQFSQGCGGPGGVGILLDVAGNDRHRADGRAPSAYGLTGDSCSFSQGCGFGYRTGGIGGTGLLADLAGDDRYDCGEFGQGCGYFLSMGILLDGSGRDTYLGNRYAQGAAAHQAFGVLIEDAGDDLFVSVTAAGQGAGWDMAVGALIDAAGNDTYRADGLSQGAAAQQAIGILLDRAGDDDYRAAGRSQGQADDNRYHWESTRCTSAGILVDRAGSDRFSLDVPAGARTVTGDRARTDGGSQWGVRVTR
jgi:hypothetical protein